MNLFGANKFFEKGKFYKSGLKNRFYKMLLLILIISLISISFIMIIDLDFFSKDNIYDYNQPLINNISSKSNYEVSTITSDLFTQNQSEPLKQSVSLESEVSSNSLDEDLTKNQLKPFHNNFLIDTKNEISNQQLRETTESINENKISNLVIDETKEYVDDNYFDDVVFVGDSITKGLEIYKSVKNAEIISQTSLNIENVVKDKIKFKGQELSILEAIKQTKKHKIYIMIGSNGIAWLDNDYMIKLYSEWVNNLRYEIKDCQIYIQSILPITKELSDKHQKQSNALTNENIDIYNDSLIKMCKQNNFNYLDVASIFKNKEGALPDEASPVDGLHINSSYYKLWLHYIKSHVVIDQ